MTDTLENMIISVYLINQILIFVDIIADVILYINTNIYSLTLNRRSQTNKSQAQTINKQINLAAILQHQPQTFLTNAIIFTTQYFTYLNPHHYPNLFMQTPQHQTPQPTLSRQQSLRSSMVSRKSTQKQTLKQEINYLKEQVKKLKIDQLNQKIMYQEGKNASYRTLQSNIKSVHSNLLENPNLPQNQPEEDATSHQPSEHTEYLMDRKSLNSIERQPLINFRVGRIVKNAMNSQQKPDFRQSKTIEVKKNNYSQGFMFNKPSNSRLINDHKNSQIHSEQIFRTIQSNHKFSFLEDTPAIAQILDLKPVQNNFLERQLLQLDKKKTSLVNFDETIQSAELQLPITNDYNNHQSLKINSNLKDKHAFSKSTTFKLPDNFSRTSKAKTDKVWFTSTNPEYQQEQIGDTIRDRNINIRKISYKLKKPNNTSRDPEIKRKQKLMEEFLKHQAQNQQKHSRYAVGSHQNQQNHAQNNIDYEAIKSSIINKKNFKARVMSKSKVYAQNLEQELKHKLRGKIIKNFGQIDAIQPQQADPESQNQFSPDQMPNSKFSLSQMPFFGDKPHPKSNQQEIINLTLSIARKLSITSIKRQPLQGIVIKKFKNCLIFSIPQTNKKIIWYYEGRFYFGQGQKQGEQGYKSGQGIEFIPDKSLYKGQFYENRKHGSGIMISQNGNIYEGQWAQGHQNGNGKLYDAENNRLYEGEFKNGKFYGLGVLKISQNEIYKGTFLRNIKSGYGVEMFKNGDKYKGEYQSGKFHGKGRYTWSNGNVYEGQFVMGLRTGSGKWKSSRQGGDIYIGMYLNDKKHGLGKYCWPDGSIFEGTFQKDEKHGQGILTYRDGKKVHGGWENNQLVQLLNVENEEQQDERVKTFKGKGCEKAELIERIPNEMIRPKRLRNI